MDACSIKRLPMMEYSVVVNLPTEALIDVLLPPALPLLDKLRRFHNKGRTCRVIT